MRLEPGMMVQAPRNPDWGVGQVQTVVGDRVTVTFAEVGRVVLDMRYTELDWVAPGTGTSAG
jgi:hypothetical protein